MIVYKATNNNGKVYIGQTTRTLRSRKSQHIRDFRYTYFHSSLRKYGVDNFKWEVICICPNISSLNEQEEAYISFYDSTNKRFGYNLKKGGDNHLHSERTKKKMSGKNNHMYHKPSEKCPFYGKNHTKETNETNRQAKLGKKASKETRKRISKARKGQKSGFKGKSHSKEACKKISIAKKDKPSNRLGVILSKEIRLKMSIAQKKRWKNTKEKK